MTSPTEILSEDSLGQKRISFFSGNRLLECWIEKENTSLRIGEIHYARVVQVEKLLNRIFYKLNNGLEVSSRLNDKKPNIGDLEIITITAEGRENKPAHAQQGFFLKGGSAIIIDNKEFLGISKKFDDSNFVLVSYGFADSVNKAMTSTSDYTILTFKMIGRLVTGEANVKKILIL